MTVIQACGVSFSRVDQSVFIRFHGQDGQIFAFARFSVDQAVEAGERLNAATHHVLAGSPSEAVH